MKAGFSDMINMKFGGSIGGETALLNSNRIQSGWGYHILHRRPKKGDPIRLQGVPK
jgi:hypothetical protein